MKRTIVGVAVLTMACVISLAAQAPKPYPEMKKLQPFIGDWITESDAKATPLGPAGKTSGKTNGRWLFGGFYLEWQYSYANASGQKIEGREIDCYDPITKTFPARWFESDGSYTSGVYTPNGNVITFLGTTTTATRKFEYRQTYTYAPDGMSYAYKEEISLDGKTWILSAEGKGTRPKPAK